jgi:hypothetical protein
MAKATNINNRNFKKLMKAAGLGTAKQHYANISKLTAARIAAATAAELKVKEKESK